jgi:PBP1b-binding outer membrane lipoprotein LpoB
MTGCAKSLLMVASVTLWLAGCSREQTVPAAAKDLEKTFQTKAAEPVKTATATPVEREDVKSAVSKAVVAMRTNGYAEAFFTLRSVQAAPNLTLDQYTAIQNARLAVERDLANKAVAGDAAALKALEQIQKSH